MPGYEETELDFYWDNGRKSIDVLTAPEGFEHPCGFVRLRERHRVKAGSHRWELPAAEEDRQ